MLTHRTRRQLCLGLLGLAAGSGPAIAGGPYLAFAQGLAAHPPKGSRYRPDLEAELPGGGARACSGHDAA